jgi:hypothetical protein
MKNFLQLCGIEFDGDYIKIPTWCKRVKLDIGLSENAPQSQIWLEREGDLLIFGFEPLLYNLLSIRRGNSKWPIKLDPKFINHRFLLIEAALSNVTDAQTMDFFETYPDTGCSSLLEPKSFGVTNVSHVIVWSLNHFLEFFPFHIIPYIDYIKTDCQGTDLEILRGCSKYLSKVAIYTCEADNRRYINSKNSIFEIDKLFKLNGFKRYRLLSNFFSKNRILNINVDDPTYINQKLIKEIKDNSICAYQKG